jgi:hypothetical protein
MDIRGFFRPKPDDESQRSLFRCLNVDEFDNRRVFLKANAGAGKTSEILKFVQQHQQYSICLLSYTRSVVLDIQKKMPKRLKMDVMTYDSLCLNNRNSLFEYKRPDKTFLSLHTANKVMKHVLFEHDPHFVRDRLEKNIIENHLPALYEHCKENDINNVTINKLLMLHRYCYKPYDIMIIDEAQDLDYLKRIFFDKKHIGTKAKIFVGDPKQSLYTESTVFDTIKDDDIVVQLSHTFRYGSELVKLLNTGPCTLHSAFPDKKTKVNCVSIEHCVTKMNVVLISAWKHIVNYTDLIGASQLTVDKKACESVENNFLNHKKYLKHFETYQKTYDTHRMEQEDYFESINEEHLLEFQTKKWGELRNILSSQMGKRKRENVPMITTVNRSKGLEYKHVYVDISCFPDHNTNPSSTRMKDNIFYTAITRSMVSVNMPEKYTPYSRTKEANLNLLSTI